MSKEKAYLYLEGIQQLAQEVRGDEKIYTAIRPYALHAGNVLSIVAYPYLLCENVKKHGIEPRFEFIVSINDWEQDQLIGPDIHKYIFDAKPLHTTIAHAVDSDGNNMVDKWQPHIETEVSKIKKDFPHVIITFVRNSSLKPHPLMKHVLLHTIEHFKEHKELLLKTTGKPTLGETMHFANALCSRCLDANTNTQLLTDGSLETNCENCGKHEVRSYDDCDFWLYHKQLFPPRLAILDFEITISGADHYLQGDFEVRKALFEYIYNKPMPTVKMAFAPLLLAPDGDKMSKSRKNDFYLPFEDILPHARTNFSPSLQITE
ncbi:MAG TPA: hypothetical protein VFH06_02020 [Candidatus Saccharimonadales bacterium]|nr:hypothetical protein [Candidatus Saccharimonadales bacterium]